MKKIPQFIVNIIKQHCDLNGDKKLERSVTVDGIKYDEVGIFNAAMESYNEKESSFIINGKKYNINDLICDEKSKDYIIQKSDNTSVSKKILPIITKKISKITLQKPNPLDSYVINGQRAFEKNTVDLLNKKYTHKTKLLDIAQKNLGLIETTADEYEKLSDADKARTHMKIVSEVGGNPDDLWCAYTVSYLAKQAGMDTGSVKASVYKNKNNNWISWAKSKHTWIGIKTNRMTENNYTEERQKRADFIREQLCNMNEGDFIVWSSQFIIKTDDPKKTFKTSHASHIGIIEKVDIEKGTVTVIEGNANIFANGNNAERLIVTEENTAGNQHCGEFKEVNNRDGLIRKIYTVEELAQGGYGGYIDNSKIVK